MIRDTIDFTYRYVTFGLIIAATAWGFNQVFDEGRFLSEHFWLIFLFLFAITFIAFAISQFGVRKGGQTGVVAIMGGLIVKLLFAMVFALVLVNKQPGNQTVFALNYFSLYLLFTLFEVICLLRNLRHQNNK